jgi:quinoprotein glucose dehydrogenase
LLKTLAAIKDEHLDATLRLALDDREPLLRAEARKLLSRQNPSAALPLLDRALADATTFEKQSAYATLAEMNKPEADALLGRWLDRLQAREVPLEVQLDLLEAAKKRGTEELKKKLQAFETSRPKDDPLAPWRETLQGGDAARGRQIFLGKTEVACLRCHKVQGNGGEVGPDITGIGAKQTREYLLESIVDPNKQIAKGYETLVLTLTNGKTVVGIVKSEDEKEVKLITAEAKLITVPKRQIDERVAGKSAMPDDLHKLLSKKELRDLVEFLATVK